MLFRGVVRVEKMALGISEFERNSVKRNFGNEIPQELSFKVVTETEWKELQPFSRTEPLYNKKYLILTSYMYNLDSIAAFSLWTFLHGFC